MGQFSIDLSRLVEKAKGKQEVAVKKVMLELFSKVIYKSPVRSGRFRANWTIGNGNANRTTSMAEDKAGAGTIGKIAADISAINLAGQSIWLTNSLPYSLILENGRGNGKPGSLQAPQGMVKITLMEISAKYGR